MDFRGRVESFEDADLRYEELSRRREAGELDQSEFEAEVQQLMVRDDGGTWWAKLGEAGEWRYRDGGDWVPGTPPGREAPESHQKTEAMAVVPEQTSAGGKKRRFPLWIPLVALLGVLLLVGVVLLTTLSPLLQGDQGSAPQGESGAAMGSSESDASGPEAGVAFQEVFVHRATPENISSNSTYIDDPLTNENPEAVLIVTQNWNPGGEGGTYNDHAVGVWYDSSRQQWAIFNQDREPMTEEAAFNVAVR